MAVQRPGGACWCCRKSKKASEAGAQKMKGTEQKEIISKERREDVMSHIY